MSPVIKVLVVEDDQDFRYLIQKMINKEADMQVVKACGTRQEAVRLAVETEPDIVLMDLNLSDLELEGIEASREIRVSTGAKVIILTAIENPALVIDASVKGFASGYVFKSQFESLVQTIRGTATGYTPQECLIRAAVLLVLSPAEQSVLEYIMGNTGGIQSSAKTISNQKTSILRKLGLRNQKELLHVMSKYGE